MTADFTATFPLNGAAALDRSAALNSAANKIGFSGADEHWAAIRLPSCCHRNAIVTKR
jgi:hypothetical protein